MYQGILHLDNYKNISLSLFPQCPSNVLIFSRKARLAKSRVQYKLDLSLKFSVGHFETRLGFPCQGRNR